MQVLLLLQYNAMTQLFYHSKRTVQRSYNDDVKNRPAGIDKMDKT